MSEQEAVPDLDAIAFGYEGPLLSMVYSGELADDGRMDVTIYTHGLRSMDRLIEGVTGAFGGVAIPSEIIGAPRRGSVWSHLRPPDDPAIWALWISAVDFILTWVGVPTAPEGFRKIQRWLQNKNDVFEIKSLFDPDTPEGKQYTVLKESDALKHLKGATSPLTKNRAATVSLGTRERVVKLNRQDALDLGVLPRQLPIAEEKLFASLPPFEHVSEQLLLVHRPSFSSRGQWEFIADGVLFSAPVLDQDFLEKVSKRLITFGKGDRLRALVRRIDWRGKNPTRTWQVLEVRECISGPPLMI